MTERTSLQSVFAQHLPRYSATHALSPRQWVGSAWRAISVMRHTWTVIRAVTGTARSANTVRRSTGASANARMCCQ